MNTDTFQYLLEKTRLLTKQTTVMRVPISPEEQLAVTLRFMATGESYRSLMYQYRIRDASISKIIPRVSDAIISTLMEECLPFPQRVEDWDKTEGFRTDYKFIFVDIGCQGRLRWRCFSKLFFLQAFRNKYA